MSQLFEAFRCGDGEALVTFVYGEATPAERDAIANHIARCATCADEVAALGSTREQLAAWTPPEHTLGFRITRAEAAAVQPSLSDPPAPVLRPGVWWQQPLPAWAQMAAAVVIFASGMALGGVWSAPPSSPSAVATTSTAPATTNASTAAVPAAVTREDLAQIEQRLRGEIAQARTSATSDAGSADSRAVMQRVSQMIAASEARQQNELNLRTSVLAQDWQNRRMVDLNNIERRLGSTTVRVLNNQQDLNSLAQRVGLSPMSSPYVP